MFHHIQKNWQEYPFFSRMAIFSRSTFFLSRFCRSNNINTREGLNLRANTTLEWLSKSLAHITLPAKGLSWILIESIAEPFFLILWRILMSLSLGTKQECNHFFSGAARNAKEILASYSQAGIAVNCWSEKESI